MRIQNVVHSKLTASNYDSIKQNRRFRNKRALSNSRQGSLFGEGSFQFTVFTFLFYTKQFVYLRGYNYTRL